MDRIFSNPLNLLLYGVGIIVVLAVSMGMIKLGDEANKRYEAEKEQKKQKELEEQQARMQTVTVEDIKTVEDTVYRSGIGVGTVLIGGNVGVGTSVGKGSNDLVIRHYVYLRTKDGCLIQFGVNADKFAALSCQKDKEITVEMFSDYCLWNGVRLNDKFVIEQAS